MRGGRVGAGTGTRGWRRRRPGRQRCGEPGTAVARGGSARSLSRDGGGTGRRGRLRHRDGGGRVGAGTGTWGWRGCEVAARGVGAGSVPRGGVKARAARHVGAGLERRGAWVKAVGDGAGVEPKFFSIFCSF
jgi:hypothetical protein